MSRVTLDELVVTWTGGGLWLDHPHGSLLLDAPEGVVDVLGEAGLGRLSGVVLTGDRTRQLVGLVPLLAALEPHRGEDLPFEVRFPLGAERGVLLAETWVRGWPDRYPLVLDAAPPGSSFEMGPFEIQTLPLRTGDPHWRRGTVAPTVGIGIRVHVDDVSLAWVPGSAPDRHIAKLCAGVDLAVIEVGRRAWPRTQERWRLTEAEAIEACGDAAAVWLPGDDGSLERDES